MSVVPVRTSPLKPVPLFNHPDGAWREPSSLSKVETPLEKERVISRECEKLDADITPRSHPCGGTGCRHGGRCVEPVLAWSLERDYPEESSHSPPPSARLHSYSPPFDLHVGSNCGAASPARHPGTSSARPAAPRHSCISTPTAGHAPSNENKNKNTNEDTIGNINENTKRNANTNTNMNMSPRHLLS